MIFADVQLLALAEEVFCVRGNDRIGVACFSTFTAVEPASHTVPHVGARTLASGHVAGPVEKALVGFIGTRMPTCSPAHRQSSSSGNISSHSACVVPDTRNSRCS